ncbi:MAG: hypothetical protein QM817_30365 [Archangium sp.]
MTPTFATLGMRLARALGFDVDPEYFNEDACWTLVAKLEEFTNEQKKLDPTVLHLLEEIAMTLNVRGGDATRFHDALEAQLGSSPFPASTIVSIVQHVRGQLHFATRKAPVQLHMHHREHVPLKSLDYGDDDAE